MYSEVMNLKILLSNKSGIPIYEQVETQIREQIMDGTLSEGELLPSIRQLARDLQISVITTARAYSELEQQGLITTVPGKGTYVLEKDNDLVREQYLKKIEDCFVQAVDLAKLAHIERAELLQMLTLMMEE